MPRVGKDQRFRLQGFTNPSGSRSWRVWFPVTGALCKAINFMVFRPVHHTGGFVLA